MIGEIQQIAQLGGTVVTVVIFLYFLQRLIDSNRTTNEENTEKLLEVIKDSNKVIQQLAIKLQEFSNTSIELSKTNREVNESNKDLRITIIKMYEWQVSREKKKMKGG